MSCFYGTGMALTERPEITFSPDTPIILGQSAVSPNNPVFFSVFLSPNALGCENWYPPPTPITI